MKTTVVFEGKEIGISAKHIGVTIGQGRSTVYTFKVTISYERKKVSFMYNDSINNYYRGITELSELDLIGCLQSFIIDCICGTESLEDFILEFGLELEEGTKIHRLCKKQYAKFERLFGNEVDIYELDEYLKNKYDF